MNHPTMKRILLSLAILLSGTLAFAQKDKCYTDEAHGHHLHQNPSREAIYKQNEEMVRRWIENNKDQIQSNKGSAVISIPVVFHIVYKNATQNIADSNIYRQVEILNESFRKTNANFSQTRPIFDTIAADVEIEFCLATVDPSGQWTTGITRTQAPSSAQFNPLIGMDNVKRSANGGKDPWPTDQYLNIWICDMSFLGITLVLGYAQFPGGDPLTDGVVIQYQFTGFMPNNTTNTKGKTTVHEVGHWLGLRHIWGDGQLSSPLCDSTDYVDDTPNADTASQQTCVIKNSCSNESAYWTSLGIDPPDMIENYMDYSYDDCMTMFTNGQKDRMQGFLNTVRASLLTSQGCVTTGLPTLAGSNNQVISVFPNPFAGDLSINLNQPGNYTVNITDLSGRLLKKLEVSSNVSSVDVSELASGMLLFEVVQNGNVVQVGKLIKTD